VIFARPLESLFLAIVIFDPSPADERKVQPYDPFNFHHHLIHRKEAHYRGQVDSDDWIRPVERHQRGNPGTKVASAGP
jgi:hypothetical protein